MKKNLFLVFSLYFFVLQPIIIGILRKEHHFFWLGGINLVMIVLISILLGTKEQYQDTTHTPHPEPTHDHKHESKILKDSKVVFHNYLNGGIKDRKKKSELYLPLVISVLVMVGMFFLFQNNNTTLAIIVLFSIVLGFLVFVSLTFLLKHRFTKSFFALRGTRVFIIFFVCSGILVAYDYLQLNKETPLSRGSYLKSNFFGQTTTTYEPYVLMGTGNVLGSGISAIETGEEQVSSDILSGTMLDSNINEETGTVLGTSTDVEEITTNPETTSDITTTKGNQKIMDAVIYLLKKHNIPLITKHDISFTYVSFKNENYDYWRTAYANKLIGKTTNPNKYIVCESYIVMKGILEKRNVAYTSNTVLTKFRAEAQKRNALNGCVKGKIVTDKNL